MPVPAVNIAVNVAAGVAQVAQEACQNAPTTKAGGDGSLMVPRVGEVAALSNLSVCSA